MNKTFTRALAAIAAAATIATALPAQAQSRHRDSDRDGRSDRAEWNRDRDRDGRADQWDRSDRPRNHGQRHWRDRQNRNWSYYGGSYGYEGYRGTWRTGQRYEYYRNRSYYLSDYRAYGLPTPRRGYRYYRDSNGDILMAAITSGVIGLIIGSAISDNDRDDRYDRR